MSVINIYTYLIKRVVFLKKHFCMKKKIVFVVSFVLIAWATSTCSKLTDCEFCKIVTKTSGGAVVTSGSETEYCGAVLVAYKTANQSVTDPLTKNVTAVECHK
jgi:hypothetical protein